MNLLLFSLLVLTLQSAKGSNQEAGSYRTLKLNVLVLTMAKDGSSVRVPLRCGESYEDRKIVWRSDGTEVAQGNRINVTVREMQGGNYTCHNDTGSYLNHTAVLVHGIKNKILEKTDDTDYIQCTSKNYSGVFRCSWKWSPSRKSDVLLVTVARSSVEITCSLDPGGQSITCLDHTHCPYSEEVERINLTVYVYSSYRVEKYTRHFYIGEIVKPDRIKITKVDNNTLEWGYPETWSVPYSYFPLTFQVKRIPLKQDCGFEYKGRKHRRIQLHTTQSRRWPVKKRFRFCIRAQDALSNSSWSDWSRENENYLRPPSGCGSSASRNRNHQK